MLELAQHGDGKKMKTLLTNDMWSFVSGLKAFPTLERFIVALAINLGLTVFLRCFPLDRKIRHPVLVNSVAVI